jgi:D-glycero-D-manno-heptose 1,7-bisphosphate phosphatase
VTRAVFLDRDGVINRKPPEGEYITEVSQFELLPRAADAIARIEAAGFAVIVVSNQRGIARGSLTQGRLAEIHRRMQQSLAAAGARLAGVYVCPHEGNCDCRKPRPGMLLQAAAEHRVSLAKSWMVGDSDCDIEAGKAAGCATIRVGSRANANALADFTVPSLTEAADLILARAAVTNSTHV